MYHPPWDVAGSWRLVAGCWLSQQGGGLQQFCCRVCGAVCVASNYCSSPSLIIPPGEFKESKTRAQARLPLHFNLLWLVLHFGLFTERRGADVTFSETSCEAVVPSDEHTARLTAVTKSLLCLVPELLQTCPNALPPYTVMF